MVKSFPEWINNICFLRAPGPADAGAFERALRLCERTGAELSIVSVIEDPPSRITQMLESWGASAEAITGEEEATAAGERLAEIACSRGVKASSELLRGTRFLEVSRKVLRDQHDLLIKAAEPTHVLHRMLIGHIDRQLIRKCPCPVWIEKPTGGKMHDSILAAVDPAPFRDDLDDDPVREELNTSILQYAELLAQVEEAELHVFHAWSFDLETSLRSRANLGEEAITEVAETFRKKHEESLSDLVGPHKRNISHVHLVKGSAGEEIARLATRESIDVIVMGTLCRTGLGGMLIGNTAETVLDHADCSIVALKPKGFIAPIDL